MSIFKKRQKREPWTTDNHFTENDGKPNERVSFTCNYCGYTFTSGMRDWDAVEDKMEKHLMCYHIK